MSAALLLCPEHPPSTLVCLASSYSYIKTQLPSCPPSVSLLPWVTSRSSEQTLVRFYRLQLPICPPGWEPPLKEQRHLCTPSVWQSLAGRDGTAIPQPLQGLPRVHRSADTREPPAASWGLPSPPTPTLSAPGTPSLEAWGSCLLPHLFTPSSGYGGGESPRGGFCSAEGMCSNQVG